MDQTLTHFQTLVELCPDPIILSCNTKMVYCNNAGLKILKAASESDIINKSIFDIIHPDDQADFKERIQFHPSTVTHQHAPFKGKLIRLDGTMINVHILTLPTTYQQLPAIQLSIHDIEEALQTKNELTHQHEKLKKMLKKLKKIRAADVMKSEFMATMSHELRTPLNAIIGFSEMLKDGLIGSLTSKQQNYCEEIFNSGKYLLSLINDILDISKIEAGKIKFEPTLEDIPTLLEHAMNIIKEKATSQNIQCQVVVDKNIKEAYVDPQKIKQILYNMLSNALKFTLPGGIITLSCHLEADNRLALSVKDTGIGISEKNLKHLFKPFFQIKEAQIKQQTGTGLGLVMIKHLTKVHSGTVDVHSELGRGTTFTVKIPYITHLPERDHSTLHFTPIPNEKPHILVVEDDLKSAELICSQLSTLDIELECVQSAEEALSRLEKNKNAFDLIILDIVLPGVNGWEMLSTIKKNKKLESIPVIIISVVADEKKGIGLGALEVLQKPIGRYQLTHAIQKYYKKVEMNKPFTVLAVDDDPNVLSMIETYLKSKTCKIVGAINGQVALDEIKKHIPDLIILDLVMPGITGFDVIEHLRKDPNTSDIPVLILTSKFLTEDDRHKLDSGVVKILMKNGLSASRFRNEIKRIIRH